MERHLRKKEESELKSEDFLKQFLGGGTQKAKGEVEGETLIEWSYRPSAYLRVATILVPILLFLGYYAYKYLRGVKFAPLDLVITFFLIVFGSRLAGATKKYSLTTVGVFALLGTTWRALGRWGDFEHCRREGNLIVLARRKGFPRRIKLSCSETEKALHIMSVANEQISRRRWR
jgi:hypothetical protein